MLALQVLALHFYNNHPILVIVLLRIQVVPTEQNYSQLEQE